MPNAASPDALRLFVIEDCRLVRMGLQALLGQFPEMQLLGEASSCEEAREAINRFDDRLLEECPDVLLVDIGLPDGSGLDLIQELQVRFPTFRFIVLTSHESPEELHEALAIGASAYCLKRVSTPILMDVIRAVQSGAMWVDAHMAHHVSQFLKPAQGESGEIPLTPEQEQTRDYLLGELSERERDVLKYLVEGYSNVDIAKALFISVHTTKYYISNLLSKMDVADRVQLAVKAVRLGLVK
jgi:two-component system, NarL family, response regulator LiaR